MKIEKVNINELVSPSYNPRDITPEEMEKLKNSITEFGYVDTIVVNEVNNHVIGGNQRLQAMKELGYNEVEVSLVHIEDMNREKALNIRLNNASGTWDNTKLENILEEMELDHFDISLTGFDDLNIDLINTDDIPFEDENNNAKPIGDLIDKYTDENNTGEEGSLKKDYIQPPFSILKGNSKDWLDLKRELKEQINDNTESRENLIGDAFGTSLFDPVLATLMIKWFTPKGKSYIIDCFSGDSVIGSIASKLGHTFTGIELRQEQVDLNNSRLSNNESKYICDDGQNILNHIKPATQDLLFSCPPYFDMEVYSDLPNDASNQESYTGFIEILKNAFTNSAKCLKEDRFAIIVISNIRDKQGFYYPMVHDIIKIFNDCGMGLYNDMILADPIGSAGLRTRRTFRNRKVVKVHQNVLVFYKGNPSNIQDNFQLECEE